MPRSRQQSRLPSQAPGRPRTSGGSFFRDTTPERFAPGTNLRRRSALTTPKQHKAEPPLEHSYRARVAILEAKCAYFEDRFRSARKWLRTMAISVLGFSIAGLCVMWVMWSIITNRDASRDQIN